MKPDRHIAYLWVPYFATAVARRADHSLDERPLVLLDEQGRAMAADARAAAAGVVAGLNERAVAARCPPAALLPASRFPLPEAQEVFTTQVRAYADRWQPDGPGSVYMDTAGVGRDLLGWCQAVAVAVRTLGWEPALGATGSKFGATVAGQAAGQNTALLMMSVTQRNFLAAQPVVTLPLDFEALDQLRHLGIRTLGQFVGLPAAGVLARFGPPGRTAQRWAQGLDDRPVIPPWEAPEVSTRIEFEPPLADRLRLMAALERRAERLLAPLRERFQVIGRVSLAVILAGGRTAPGTYIFPKPAIAANTVRFGVATALDRIAWDGQPAVDITLTFAGIRDQPSRQLALFDLPDAAGEEPGAGNRARLLSTLEQLSARFGPDAFRLASLTDPDNPLPARRVSWRQFDG